MTYFSACDYRNYNMIYFTLPPPSPSNLNMLSIKLSLERLNLIKLFLSNSKSIFKSRITKIVAVMMINQNI